MSISVLEKLCTERDQARDAAIAMAESEDFSPDDKTFLDLQHRAQDLDARVSSLNGLMEQRAAADALDGKLAKASQARLKSQDQGSQGVQSREASWGEVFVRSEEFTSYRRKGSSGVLVIPDDVQTRALPTGLAELVAAGMTGGKTQVDTSAAAAPTPLLDAVTQVPVASNAIEYVAWAKKAGSAATVAEKAAKPSVEYGPTVTPDTLEMIAVYTQLTRQLIEDYGAVRSLIDTELRREIAREEEEHAAAALVAATIPTADGGGDLLAGIRVGIGTVQAAGYNPNAVLLNPADYADMDVAVMGSTLLGPVIRQSFWGLVPIAATSQPAGTATVGDFKAGVQHFVRSEIQLFVTDSHADTFLTNVFTLLAERRSKTAVVRPAALVECTAGA
jgi:hypothetical protein